jgi:hypothetical protein
VEVSTSEVFLDTAGWPGSTAARFAGPVGLGVQGTADFGRLFEGVGEAVGADFVGPGAGDAGGPAGDAGADDGAEGDGEEAPGSASFFPPPKRLCQKSTMPPTMSVTMLPPPSEGDADGDGAGDGEALGLADAPSVRVCTGAFLLVLGEADGDRSAIVFFAIGAHGAAAAGEEPPAT